MITFTDGQGRAIEVLATFAKAGDNTKEAEAFVLVALLEKAERVREAVAAGHMQAGEAFRVLPALVP